MSNTTVTPGAVPETRPSRTVWIAGGLLAAASLAAAAGLALRPSAPASPLATTEAAPLSVVQSQAPVAAKAEAAAPRAVSKPVPRTTTAHAAVPAAACANCGVVESIHEVTRKGQGSGLGAVAGGVLGAAVGNQMGKGNGRAAMTVLGAVGGGFAGNEVEKRSKSETVFEVRVRLDVGTLRTFEQRSAPALGAHVVIEGNALKTVAAPRV